MIKRLVVFIISMPSLFLVVLISIYQKTLSPDHGPISFLFPAGYCRYHPTCSQYSKQALKKYGFFKGSVLSFYRILRCNPWSKGGMDELN